MKPRSQEDWSVVLDAIEWFQRQLREKSPEEVRAWISPAPAQSQNVYTQDMIDAAKWRAHELLRGLKFDPPRAPCPVCVDASSREALLGAAAELSGSALDWRMHSQPARADKCESAASTLRALAAGHTVPIASDGWVAWKRDDVMPPEGLYWVKRMNWQTVDGQPRGVHADTLFSQCDWDRCRVIAYMPTKLPLAVEPTTAKEAG